MKQREELEREKGQYAAKLEQLDTQVGVRGGIVKMVSGWVHVHWVRPQALGYININLALQRPSGSVVNGGPGFKSLNFQDSF